MNELKQPTNILKLMTAVADKVAEVVGNDNSRAYTVTSAVNSSFNGKPGIILFISNDANSDDE